MADTIDNKVLELFGNSIRLNRNWSAIVKQQKCPYSNSTCFKVRKSNPELSIGTCTVRYGREKHDIIICPNRMLERCQAFTDCLHLLTQHDPGNELHVVSEISIPGGSVDYFLASVKKGVVKDFVGIEFQTLDTTGTVWPERQRLLKALGLKVAKKDINSAKPFGMNWKMTAKTILVQIHHKIGTLENLGKHLVLVIQDHLFDYLCKQFKFSHIEGVRIGDSMHIHSYKMEKARSEFNIQLNSRLSTDSSGVAECLGLLTNPKIELQSIVAKIERKISDKTLLNVGTRRQVLDDMCRWIRQITFASIFVL